LIVRVVEIEPVPTADLDATEPPAVIPILRADCIARARRMRLLAAFERRIHGELDDLGSQETEPSEEPQPLAGQPVDARLDAAMAALLGVLRQEQERRRIAEPQLQRNLDLLVVAARFEHADI